MKPGPRWLILILRLLLCGWLRTRKQTQTFTEGKHRRFYLLTPLWDHWTIQCWSRVDTHTRRASGLQESFLGSSFILRGDKHLCPPPPSGEGWISSHWSTHQRETPSSFMIEGETLFTPRKYNSSSLGKYPEPGSQMNSTFKLTYNSQSCSYPIHREL